MVPLSTTCGKNDLYVPNGIHLDAQDMTSFVLKKEELVIIILLRHEAHKTRSSSPSSKNTKEQQE